MYGVIIVKPDLLSCPMSLFAPSFQPSSRPNLTLIGHPPIDGQWWPQAIAKRLAIDHYEHGGTVAVGTRITPRPPHRSRRALLTHRAPPSGRTSAARGLKLHALRRTAANRIDVASRLSVRTTAACRLLPSGEALPSTTSAGSCLPLFGRFLSTTASSDFSSAYMLGVRLLPSRAGPAQVRAPMRPPRFRTKNFSTCARSPTARGSSHASHYAMGDVAFSSAN